MRLSCPPRHAAASVLLLAAVAGLYACSEGSVAPQLPDDQLLAKPGGGGGGPKVVSVDPPSAPQGTTLVVTVTGSGYDGTSTVTMLLDRKPTIKVLTISTKVLSDKILEAVIKIESDADIDLYDVEVTANRGRKKGVGVESFGVVSADEVPVTAEVEDIVTVDGLYATGWIDVTTAKTDGNTRVDVQCGQGEGFVQHFGEDVNGNPLPPPWGSDDAADCDGDGARSQLMIPDVLLLTQNGPVGEQTIPPEPGGMSPYLNYFFLVDSSDKGKTKFKMPQDDQYNWVWTDASVVITTVVNEDGEEVAVTWDITASTADLVNQNMVVARGVAFALNVTLNRL